uniref:Beta-microseminoprotein n=1 Tax=Xiphophorus couchianus TaxID=32473 RepID=A0A3B5MAN2_9TELE
KKYLALAMLFCVLMSLSDCQCIFKLRTPGENQTHCQDGVDLTWHPKDTKWRNSECQNCTCDQCCYGYATPTRFPEDCVSVFDPKACQYVVHKKDNSSELCPIFAAHGCYVFAQIKDV